MIRAGACRHEVTIQQMSESVSTRGGVTPTPSTLMVWRASAEPLSATEVVRAGQSIGTRLVRFRGRYVGRVVTPDPKYRLKYDDRLFEIVSVVDADERRRETEILGVEVVTEEDA